MKTAGKSKKVEIAIYALVYGRRFAIKLKSGATREQCANGNMSRGDFIRRCKELRIPVFDAGKLSLQELHGLKCKVDVINNSKISEL